ncbi:MAG TPA: hypothetical protein VIF62_25270 [Labilithrix sp.]|jgi:hypothetical protein
MGPALLFACAVCGSAERGLPENGAETAFEGRKRATLDVRAAGFATTSGDTQGDRVVELRAEPGAAASVGERTMLGAYVPALQRTIDAPGASRETQTTLGDIELRVTYTALRAIGRHLSLDGGLKLPTAPIQHDGLGRTLTPDLQPGCSAIVPLVGATYLWSGSLASAWTSVSLLMPVSVRENAPHPGDSARASATVQLQPSTFFATRLGAYARYDSTAELDGAALPRSGGASVHVAPQVVLAPVRDLVVTLGAAFPIVQAMRAYRSTSPVLLASAGVDF